MVKFARVLYVADKVQECVPIEDIENFEPKNVKDFNKLLQYKVLWPLADDKENLKKNQRQFYKANILALGDFKEALFEKRMAPPPASIQQVLTTSSESSDTELETMPNIFDENLENGSKNKVEELEEELVQSQELLASTRKRMKTEKTESILKFQKIQKEYDQLKEELGIIQEENLRLRKLNMDLQDNVINVFKNGNRVTNEVPVPAEASEHRTDHSTAMVDFYGFKVNKHQLNSALSAGTNSVVARELAVILVGEEELAKCSVKGKKGPRTQGDAKQKMDPAALSAIYSCMKEKLEKDGFNQQSIRTELKAINRSIGQKIVDLNRKLKKTPLSIDIDEHESSVLDNV